MARREPNYIWRRAANAEWLSANEIPLHEQTSGAYAVIERPRRKQLIVEAFCNRACAARGLRSSFGGSVSQLATDSEARALAAAKTKTLRIGRRLIVAGDEHDVTTGGSKAVLIIPAGAAFGTGEHATTAMSLRMLERITRNLVRWRMLDAGTGSGILALAGRRFGAQKVAAVDNDPLAISTAKENARRNNVPGIRFRVGDVAKQQRGTFDIISANLYSELLIATLPLWREKLRPGARLIISGVMRTQEADLLRALRKNGYSTHETRRRGKWIALLCSQKRS